MTHRMPCLIWPGHLASTREVPDKVVWQPDKAAWQFDSPRAGGIYEISAPDDPVILHLERGPLDDPGRARLTTRLINHRRQTGRPLVVTEELLEEAGSARPLQVAERATRLLEYLVRHSESIGKEIILLRYDEPGAPPHVAGDGPGALAWSESTTTDELTFLCDDLTENGWIHQLDGPIDSKYTIVVTVQGYNALDQPPDSESNEAFVAMWIDKSMDDVFERGIRPGIEDAGYTAVRIDRQLKVDKIDDAILAAIRQCRFVVADFTHGGAGVRGSVYFEVGFARGLGIDVISTCRADQINALQFDTRQYYHIEWERNKLGHLRKQVAERIHARIGQGTGVAEGTSLLRGPYRPAQP